VDTAERESIPSTACRGCATALRQGLLRSTGPARPRSPAVDELSILTRWGIGAAFSAPSLKSALRLAVKASTATAAKKQRRSPATFWQAAETGRERLVDSVIGLAANGFARAGGGVRSGRVTGEDLVNEDSFALIRLTQTPYLPCLTIHLRRPRRPTPMTMNTCVSPPETLDAEAGSSSDAVRRIDQWGNLDRRALTRNGQSHRQSARQQAGLDPQLFRAWAASGYLTESGQSWYSVAGAMQQSCTNPDAGRELLQDADRKWAGLRGLIVDASFGSCRYC